jgi:HEAT repeat protein
MSDQATFEAELAEALELDQARCREVVESCLRVAVSRFATSAQRTLAVTIVGAFEREAVEAVPALLILLTSDTFQWTREAAARALGRIGDTLARATLHEVSRTDSSKWVRAACTEAIWTMRHAR